jgi:ADP-heptose:LPS heptosyltransferase
MARIFGFHYNRRRMRPIARVLVIKLGSLGEFVLSLPAMKRIREAHAKAHVTLLTTPRFAELARSSRYFDHIEPSGDLQGFGAAMSLAGWIRRSKFDRVYDLENSAHTRRVFNAMWPGRPEWSGDVRGATHRPATRHRNKLHVLERQADQLKHAGIWSDAPTTPGEAPPPDLSWILRRAPEARPVAGADKPKPYALLAPGGVSKSQELWPIDAYAELAKRLYDGGLDVFVIGSPEESAMARAIQRTTPRARDLTGRADFAQVAVLGARAALAVGNNSGAIHLMAAAGAPTLALFAGGADPELSGPRGYVAILTAKDANDISVQQVAETALALARSA